MDKFRNKYRIPSARAQWWDYGWDGSYFITICTRQHRHLFGEIIDDQMIFSDLGKIADECWREISDHSTHVELGAHVVMPNHVHGILNLHTDAAPFKSVPMESADAETIQAAASFPKRSGVCDCESQARTPSQPWSADTNPPCRNTRGKPGSISNGNRVFTTTSSAMPRNISVLRITFSTIRLPGKRINFIATPKTSGGERRSAIRIQFGQVARIGRDNGMPARP
jgi:REP element-mobilizing transposase RayT